MFIASLVLGMRKSAARVTFRPNQSESRRGSARPLAVPQNHDEEELRE